MQEEEEELGEWLGERGRQSNGGGRRERGRRGLKGGQAPEKEAEEGGGGDIVSERGVFEGERVFYSLQRK